MSRHLAIAEPQLQAARLVLLEVDGTEVCSYDCERSWHHIERDGRRFVLGGRDRATGELIYFPDGEV